MIDHFGPAIADNIEVVGEPTDQGSAQALFDASPFQFEWWALSLIQAMPGNDKKKGSDKGIDGVIRFHVDNSGKTQKCLVQVKGGAKVQVDAVRDLRGTMTREKAEMGILFALHAPTSAAHEEATNGGFYTTPTGKPFPAIQILTIQELLDGKEPRLPRDQATFKRASRITHQQNKQSQLEFGDL